MGDERKDSRFRLIGAWLTVIGLLAVLEWGSVEKLKAVSLDEGRYASILKQIDQLNKQHDEFMAQAQTNNELIKAFIEAQKARS